MPNTPQPITTLLTVDEAATQLRVSRDQVVKHFPVIRIGKRIVVRQADVQALIVGEVK